MARRPTPTATAPATRVTETTTAAPAAASPAPSPLTVRLEEFEGPLDLLLHLLDHAGTLVTKEQLLEALWPDANVTDNALAQAVSETNRHGFRTA